MRFILKAANLYLEMDGETYQIPSEDIKRLVDRPSTRVLRLMDENGVVTSTQIEQPILTIDGYRDLVDEFSMKG